MKRFFAVLLTALLFTCSAVSAQQYQVFPSGSALQITDGTNTAAIGSNGLKIDSARTFNNPAVREFATIPTPGAAAQYICQGSDGNLYGTEQNASKVFRLSLSGAFTEFALPTSSSHPQGICQGSDGNIYGNEATGGNSVFQLTPSGAINEFPIPTSSCSPAGICQGADGNLYGVEFNGNNVFQMDTSGNFTEFAIPTAASGAQNICQGFNGNLYGTESSANKVFQMTTAGAFTEFTGFSGSPYAICQGSDGNLYGTEVTPNKVFKMTTAGVITEFSVPSSTAFSICQGSDGNLYGVEKTAAKIFQMTTGGVFTEFAVPATTSLPLAICQGSDGNLYGTEFTGNCVFIKGCTLAWNNIAQNGAPVSAANPFPVSPLGTTSLSVNNGTTDAGTQRVTISSDSTGQIKLATGANVIGALTANQSINLAQVAGASPSAANPLPAQLSQGGAALSASNPIPIAQAPATTANTTMQSAAVANGNGTVLNTNGYATVALNITGTFSGTVNFEVSPDSGTTWLPCLGTQVGTTTSVTSATAAGSYQLNVTGYSQMRARISSYVSGSITAIGYLSPLSYRGPPAAAVTLASLGVNVFTSADQAAAIGTPYTLAHGLGRTPKEIWYALICQIANAGYSPGDVVTQYPGGNASSTNTGLTVWADGTNVNAISGSGAVACVGTKTTGAGVNITAADWKIRFYAR